MDGGTREAYVTSFEHYNLDASLLELQCSTKTFRMSLFEQSDIRKRTSDASANDDNINVLAHVGSRGTEQLLDVRLVRRNNPKQSCQPPKIHVSERPHCPPCALDRMCV